jgi:hypothetical protein
MALLAVGLAAAGAALVSGWRLSRTAEEALVGAVATTDPARLRVRMPDQRDARVQAPAASESPSVPVNPASVSPTGESGAVEPTVRETPLPEATEPGPTRAGTEHMYTQPGEVEPDRSPTTVSPEAIDAASLPAMPLDSHPTSLPTGARLDGSPDPPGTVTESSPTGGTESSQLPGQ